MLNSIFSSIEQDMLSNKKLEELTGNKDTSLAEGARIQALQLQEVTDALYNKDTTID